MFNIGKQMTELLHVGNMLKTSLTQQHRGDVGIQPLLRSNTHLQTWRMKTTSRLLLPGQGAWPGLDEGLPALGGVQQWVMVTGSGLVVIKQLKLLFPPLKAGWTVRTKSTWMQVSPLTWQLSVVVVSWHTEAGVAFLRGTDALQHIKPWNNKQSASHIWMRYTTFNIHSHRRMWVKVLNLVLTKKVGLQRVHGFSKRFRQSER